MSKNVPPKDYPQPSKRQGSSHAVMRIEVSERVPEKESGSVENTHASGQALGLHQSQNSGVAGDLASDSAGVVANAGVDLQVEGTIGNVHRLDLDHVGGGGGGDLARLDISLDGVNVAGLEVAELAGGVAGGGRNAERSDRLEKNERSDCDHGNLMSNS